LPVQEFARESQRFEDFFQQFYQSQIAEAALQGRTSIEIDFELLDKFDPEFADRLLNEPKLMLDAALEAITVVSGQNLALTPRFNNLPDSQKIRIRSLRSEHIGKFIAVDCVVRRASEVRPEIYEATFECLDCGAKIPVVQTERNVKSPAACETCGKHGKFNLIDRKLFDARWIVAEEPYEIAAGEKSSDVRIYLKDDLTSPDMQRRSDPGSRLTVVGILKDMKKILKGTLGTQMDIFLDANHVKPTEIEWEEINITEEDEKQIEELSKDPQIYQKIVASLAPSIFGMDEIKEAVAYQLFSGVQRTAADGTRLRGDIHLLLVGDPALGKSVTGDSRILYRSDSSFGYTTVGKLIDQKVQNNHIDYKGSEITLKNNENIEVITLNPQTYKFEWKRVDAFIRHESPENLVRILTRSGRSVTATHDHSFLVLDENGDIVDVKGTELKEEMYVPLSIGTHVPLVDNIEILSHHTRTNALMLQSKVSLGPEFGFFLGMFLSEGSLNKGSVFVDTYNMEQKQMMAPFIKSIGLKPDITDTRMVFSSRNMVDWLEKNCYNGNPKIGQGKGSGAIRKRLPDFCHFAPVNFVKGLLSGLFSGDGYITSSNGSFIAGYSTISKDLADGIADLLSSIGIFSKIRHRVYFYKGDRRINYEVEIYGRHLERFLSFTKIIGKSKTVTKVAQKDSIDAVPCGKLIYDIVRSLGYSRRLHKDSKERRSFAAMMRTVRSRNRLGRRRLERIYDRLILEAESQKNEQALQLLEKMKRLIDSQTVWDQIVKIENVSPIEKYVYDLSINGNETFVVNGLAVHNTQILKLVSKVIPRGRYVSGKGVTGVGLTASVTKDEEFMGGWVLEAGAMVLCHKSLIAIDEFDKMNKDDMIAMHEAMSTQTISIAKASIIATLPAQTSVLAGANPKYSRFDPFRPLGEQIDIPDTLLSRFDLKFILRDEPKKELDEKLATHVMQVRMSPQEIKPLIPSEFLRKYIAYARHNCKPDLMPEAAERLKHFYIDMRSSYAGQGAEIPITLRQYEALMRLSEAAAKIRLSDKVTIQDAERAINIMNFSLRQIAFDVKTGKFDIDRTEGVPTSKRNMIRSILNIIEKLEKTIGKPIPLEEIITEAQNEGIVVHDVNEIITSLKRDGTLYEPKVGHLQKAAG